MNPQGVELVPDTSLSARLQWTRSLFALAAALPGDHIMPSLHTRLPISRS